MYLRKILKENVPTVEINACEKKMVSKKSEMEVMDGNVFFPEKRYPTN